jgi:hypothetical protein
VKAKPNKETAKRKPVELNYSGWMLIMELAACLLQLNGKQQR